MPWPGLLPLLLLLGSSGQLGERMIIAVPADPVFVGEGGFGSSNRSTLVDGTVIALQSKSKGKALSSLNLLENSEPWTASVFGPYVAQLRATAPRHTFLSAGFGERKIDLFDDLAWSELCRRLSILARAGRESNVEGMYLDLTADGSGKLPVFTWFDQPHWSDHKRTDYLDKARDRGRETMRALLEGNPTSAILLPHFLSDLTRTYDASGAPSVRIGDNGDLLSAFVEGWLAEINGTTNLYASSSSVAVTTNIRYSSEAGRLAGFDSQILGREFSDRFRSRVHFLPTVDLSRALESGPPTFLTRVLDDAIAASSKYVLLKITSGKAFSQTADFSNLSKSNPRRAFVSSQIGGFNPSRLTQRLEGEPNRVVNGHVVGSLGWESSVSYGDGNSGVENARGNGRGSLFLRAVRQGSWDQDIAVEGGQTYAVRAFATTVGVAFASVEIEGREGQESLSVAFVPSEGVGRQMIVGQFQVPKGMSRIKLRLVMLSPGQAGDRVAFDDIRLVEL